MTDKEKLKELLKIPIDNINIQSGYVQIFFSEAYIGSIPFYEVKGIKTYDTDQKNLTKLDWHLVYERNKVEILERIEEKVDVKAPTITLGTFRRLYVNNSRGSFICSVICEFDEEWKVYEE